VGKKVEKRLKKSPKHIIDAIHEASSDEIGPVFNGVLSDLRIGIAALGQPTRT
jgi:hypothetical protein